MIYRSNSFWNRSLRCSLLSERNFSCRIKGVFFIESPFSVHLIVRCVTSVYFQSAKFRTFQIFHAKYCKTFKISLKRFCRNGTITLLFYTVHQCTMQSFYKFCRYLRKEIRYGNFWRVKECCFVLKYHSSKIHVLLFFMKARLSNVWQSAPVAGIINLFARMSRPPYVFVEVSVADRQPVQPVKATERQFTIRQNRYLRTAGIPVHIIQMFFDIQTF